MQIRARLTLLFLFNAASILAGVLVAVYVLFKKNTEEGFFEGLRSKAEMTAQTALRDPNSLKPLPPEWVSPDGDTLPYRDNISLFNDAYERVFAVHTDIPPISAKDLQDIYTQREARFRHYNLHALGRVVNSAEGRPFVVVVEGYCDPTQLVQLRNILIIGFLAGMALIAASGWYFSGQALAPMSGIVREVENIQPSDLSRRVATGENRDEIARLAETFNRLLDRVEQAFRMQQMFLSNVSHELKNPLQAIRSQLDVTLSRERDPAAYRTALQSVLDDVDAMTEVEEKLHQLARIYNDPAAIPLTTVRLDELIWQVKKQVQKRRQDYKISLELGEMPEDESVLYIRANEALIRTALLNLMDNACKYSPDQRAQVRVRFRPDGAHEVDIADNGPGIPQDELPLIFEPFFRSPRHRHVKGTGIGLSLVRSILNLHRIALSVESPAEGGTVFKLGFPPLQRPGS
ncbi:MAG: sensor histidine kinase [Haliscomenobacteraceae bacterium CHB4]|nr:Adaptive-response sensory-kinase SasA [Saprospiraceae bacterium]MCE7921555.1 sensor histidine kinase [Haliscomenobacteraceae bacterium CHB4]